MKKLKLFFALFAMLALGVGNAWGAEVTETIKMKGFGGKTNNAYQNMTVSGTSDAGTAMVAYAYNGSTGQVRGNKTAVAGASVTSEDKDKNWSLYNSEVMAGAIKAIKVTQTATGSNKFQNNLYVSLGTSSQGTITAITNAQKQDAGGTATEINFTIDASKGYTYFKLLSTEKFGSGSLAGVEVKVTYETTSGGGDEPVATLTANPTTIDFGTVYEGATVADKTVAVNFENLTGDVTYSGLSTPFTATGVISATGDKITISADASTIGEYSQTLTIASTADSKTAEVTVKMNVVEKPAPTGTFTLHTGELIEGDYVIYYSGKAMKAVVSSNRLGYEEVTPSGNEIVDPLAATIWHIAPSGDNWTVYNNNKGYAAGTGTKSQAGLVANLTGDNANKAAWTITASGNAYEFVNVWNKSKSVNANLRNNTTFGFACYATSTGGALSLYRKAGTKYNVTVSSTTNGTVTANPTSAEAGTTITLTVTPETGYVLDALTVTDASSNTIEVADNKFTMPAADVTIAATFKENEKPAATLTLSKNGVTEDITGNKQDDVVTLPTTVDTDCVKEFVGWSADANCATEPEYAPGASYTLASTSQTLYAVYATAGAGETLTITPSAVSGSADPYTFTIDAAGFSLTAKKNGGSTAPTYTSNEVRVYAKGTVTLTAPKAMGTIVFNISTNGKKRLAPITASVGTIATQASDDATVTWTGDATEVTFTVGDIAEFGSENTKAGQLCFGTITVTTAGSYSNYSTTCAAAPKAEVNPTEVTAIAAGVEGKVTVTYENVNTANVSVALYNDAACTAAFTADWLTASLDGDKNVTYTVAATTLYTERKAYIQLTAPETNGTTEPAKVVIPVTQAGKDKVFASLEALLAAITPTAEGVEVTVTLTNEVIQDFYTSSSYRNGIALNVPYEDGVKVIEIYCKDVPAEWVKGGKVSGTITCPWKLYNSTWELCPTAWTELTYTAPATVKSIAVSGTPTKTTYVDGEAFDPTGLEVTATLTDDSTEPIDVALVDWTFDPETLSKGETSVSVVATYNTMASAAYEVTGLTVNDIPTKTVAEFIAAGGTRCYLEGIVSNIANTTYGNFDLTDETGTIFVYGCLNADGESKKFADLGVKAGDKIKVIADVYELYQGTKQEAKNVQYVSHISAATITIADITMEVGETKTIAATITPDAAQSTVQYAITSGNEYITLEGTTITAVAAGTATITATIAEKADEYKGATKEFTVTVKPQNIAELPFEFTGGKADIENTLGMYQEGLGNDYSGTTNLRFDNTGDCVIIHFNGQAEKLAYDIKGNSFSNGTFTIQQSADGSAYTDVVTYTELGNAATKEHELAAESRYVKFIYTEKSSGNVGLGNIKITKPDNRADAGLAWNPTSVTLTQGEAFTAPTLNNPHSVDGITYESSNGDVATISAEGEIALASATGTATITATFAGDGTYKPATATCIITVNEDIETIDGEWQLVTDASKLQAGMEIIIASVAVDDKYYTLGKASDNGNNRTAVESTISGDKLNPAVGTSVLTLVDAGNGTFALQASNGQYLYAASSTSNHLKETATINDNAKWAINVTDGKASIIAQGTYTRNIIRYNSNSTIFSCYASGQQDIALYKKMPDYTRDVRQGYYGTICLPNGGVMVGASIFEIAYKDASKIYFDEILSNEMVAGTPYIFLPIDDVDQIEVYYTDEANASAGSENGLVGSYTQELLAEDGNNYILLNNQYCEVIGEAYVGANRAYFQLSGIPTSAPAPAPGVHRVSMGMAGQNTATGVDQVQGDEVPTKMIINGQLFIIRGEKMYDAQGKLVK